MPALFVATLAVASLGLGVVPGPGDGVAILNTAASASSGQLAVTPPNNHAYIFNALPWDTAKNASSFANSVLRNESYHVTEFDGTGTLGNATLKNFIAMAGAGVIAIETHGCVSGCSGGTGLVAESYSGPFANVEADRATQDYLTGAFGHPKIPQQYFKELKAASVFDSANLLITKAGIQNYFGKHPSAMIFDLSCEGFAFATDFNPLAFFSYPMVTKCPVAATDMINVFSAIGGQHGLSYRTTSGAFNYAKNFAKQSPLVLYRRPGASAVTLSPAVSLVTPAGGSLVGSATAASIAFDTAMTTQAAANPGTVTVSGCGGQVSAMYWASPGNLQFKLVVSPSAAGSVAVLTLHYPFARAAGGFPNQLDGNTNPAGNRVGGQIPNADDYTWNLICPQPVPLVNGKTVTSVIPAGGWQTYSWAGTPGQHVTFDVTAASWLRGSQQGSGYLRLYAPDGSILASIDFNGATYLDVFPPVSGTYTAELAGDFGASGNVTMTLAQDITGTLTPGVSVTPDITHKGQRADYSWTAAAGQHVTFDMTAASWLRGTQSYSGYLYLYAADGQFVDSLDFNGPAYLSYTPKTSGTYSAVLAGDYGATGTVTMTLAKDLTGVINAGSSLTTNITYKGQRAVYAWSATADRLVTFNVTSASWQRGTIPGSGGLTLYLPSGGIVTSIDFNGPTTLQYTPTISGTYTAVLAGDYGATGSITMTLLP